jgi:hypothetical protein
MPLFKYCSPERTDIVKDLKIRFTPPSRFNDPFECWPTVASLIDHPRIIADVKAEIARNNDVHPETIADESVKQALNEDTCRTAVRENLRKNQDIFIRILTLSLVPPDDPLALLMWGHYSKATNGKGHDGLCLEFDDQHPWVTRHKREQCEGRDSAPVTYSRRRPAYTSTDPEKTLLFTKSEEWKYEQEFRLVRLINDPELEKDPTDALVKFNADLLKSVTLGVNATADTENELRQLLKANPALSRVKLQRARPHENEYRLTLENIPI